MNKVDYCAVKAKQYDTFFSHYKHTVPKHANEKLSLYSTTQPQNVLLIVVNITEIWKNIKLMIPEIQML